MVYIRNKKVKGIEYAYLVKSEWDRDRGTSRQRTIKYLGRAAEVKANDIPEEYRNDTRVLAFLSSRSMAGTQKRQAAVLDLQNELLGCLAAGDLEGALRLYDMHCRSFHSLTDFYDEILTPVMYEVGTRWEQGKMDVATEHVCTNVANALVKAIGERAKKGAAMRTAGAAGKGRDGAGRVLVCTPGGEQHCLACNIIESILSSNGYRVYNASPSAPAESILRCIDEVGPDAILVSITLDENVGSSERLVQKIRSRFPRPAIMVGGLAVRQLEKSNFPDSVIVANGGRGLEGQEEGGGGGTRDILRLLKSAIGTAI